MSDSTITILGNLAAGPVLRTTGTGRQVATFPVASSRSRLVEGAWVSGETTYLDVDCWEPMAQNVMATLALGMAVVVHGRLETSRWKTPEGEDRAKTRVHALAVGPDLRRVSGRMARTVRTEYEAPGAGGAAAARPGGAEPPAAEGEDAAADPAGAGEPAAAPF